MVAIYKKLLEGKPAELVASEFLTFYSNGSMSEISKDLVQCLVDSFTGRENVASVTHLCVTHFKTVAIRLAKEHCNEIQLTGELYKSVYCFYDEICQNMYSLNTLASAKWLHIICLFLTVLSAQEQLQVRVVFFSVSLLHSVTKLLKGREINGSRDNSGLLDDICRSLLRTIELGIRFRSIAKITAKLIFKYHEEFSFSTRNITEEDIYFYNEVLIKKSSIVNKTGLVSMIKMLNQNHMPLRSRIKAVKLFTQIVPARLLCDLLKNGAASASILTLVFINQVHGYYSWIPAWYPNLYETIFCQIFRSDEVVKKVAAFVFIEVTKRRFQNDESKILKYILQLHLAFHSSPDKLRDLTEAFWGYGYIENIQSLEEILTDTVYEHVVYLMVAHLIVEIGRKLFNDLPQSLACGQVTERITSLVARNEISLDARSILLILFLEVDVASCLNEEYLNNNVIENLVLTLSLLASTTTHMELFKNIMLTMKTLLLYETAKNETLKIATEIFNKIESYTQDEIFEGTVDTFYKASIIAGDIDFLEKPMAYKVLNLIQSKLFNDSLSVEFYEQNEKVSGFAINLFASLIERCFFEISIKKDHSQIEYFKYCFGILIKICTSLIHCGKTFLSSKCFLALVDLMVITESKTLFLTNSSLQVVGKLSTDLYGILVVYLDEQCFSKTIGSGRGKSKIDDESSHIYKCLLRRFNLLVKECYNIPHTDHSYKIMVYSAKRPIPYTEELETFSVYLIEKSMEDSPKYETIYICLAKALLSTTHTSFVPTKLLSFYERLVKRKFGKKVSEEIVGLSVLHVIDVLDAQLGNSAPSSTHNRIIFLNYLDIFVKRIGAQFKQEIFQKLTTFNQLLSNDEQETLERLKEATKIFT